MKQTIAIFTVAIFVFALLVGCSCQHEWRQADCKAPKTCSVCALTEGGFGDHSWEDATCNTPKTCKVCAKTEGAALGHSWDGPSTCKSAAACTRCQITDTTPIAHTWIPADCQKAKTCAVCAVTEGVPAGHSWIEATTENPTMCTVCGWSMDDQIITDSRFHTADCQALFGHWVYAVPGTEMQYFEFRNNGTGAWVSLNNLDGISGGELVYYVSDGQLYLGSSWDAIAETYVSWSVTEGQLLINGSQYSLRPEYPEFHLGNEAVVFDAQVCAPLFGSWRTRGFDPNAHMSIEFSDDGSMTLYAGFLVEGQKEYTYTVENGQLIFGSSQLGTKNEWAYTLADHVLTLTVADQQYTLYLSI